MTLSPRRRIAGFGTAAVLAVAGARWATADGTPSPEPAAAVHTVGWWSQWTPRTLRPATTTTTEPATTTTAAPDTTQAPPPTEAPATTAARRTTRAATPSPAPAQAPVVQAPVTTQAPTPPAPVSGALAASTQRAMLDQLNALRASGTTCGGVAYPPVPALQLQGDLTRAADAHAADMASRDYFSHNSLDGTDPGTRMSRAGYRWSAWAENIAAGQPTPASVVSGWFASAGHCQNFMSSAMTQVGFGYAERSGSTYTRYWVADLGRPA